VPALSVLMLGSPAPWEPAINRFGLNVMGVAGGAAFAGCVDSAGIAIAIAPTTMTSFFTVLPDRTDVPP
jgi:hypothetical protein